MTSVFHERDGAWAIVGLRSEATEIAVAPDCGAKIVRLRDVRKEREWTWSASSDRRLHRNAVGDPFEKSPLVGIDECIPTVAGCTVAGRAWPDHGEAWSRAWELDEHALEDAAIVTSIHLQTVPFAFRRTIRIDQGTIRLDYHVHNLGTDARPYAWALHPLLAFRTGDRLELPGPIGVGRVDSACRIPGLEPDGPVSWPQPAPGFRLDALLEKTQETSLKAYFPSPAPAGFTVRNAEDGTTLQARYGPVELLPYLGIWVTRGGWNGYHHFAVEPTNVIDDRADRIDPEAHPNAVLPAGGQRAWFVELRFGT